MIRQAALAVAAILASACGTQDGLHIENGGRTVAPGSTKPHTTPTPTQPPSRTDSLVLGGRTAIAYTDGTLWCAVRAPGDRLIGSLIQVDTATGHVTGTTEPLPPSDNPYLLAVTGGNVWVTGGDRLWRIDTADGSVAATVDLQGRATALTGGLGDLWVTVEDAGGGRLMRLNADTGAPVAKARLGPGPSALTVVPGAAWVTDSRRQTVTRYALRHRRIVRSATVALPLSDRRAPTQVTVYAGLVWVYERGRVIRIDPGTAAVVGTTTVAPAAGGTIAAGSGGIWVITRTRRHHSGAVRLLDGATGAGIGRRVVVGGDPSALATDGHGVWVVGGPDGRLVRVTPAGG